MVIRSSVQPNLVLSGCAESISLIHCISSGDNVQNVLKVSKFTALPFPCKKQFLMNELLFNLQKGEILLVFKSWIWKSNKVKSCGTISAWKKVFYYFRWVSVMSQTSTLPSFSPEVTGIATVLIYHKHIYLYVYKYI